ncbi:transcriptional regulator ATRX [Mangifera indica]|uniref:transcriptional regulator ATRX n=1 Tax=Mangifera indica TaxID=29780 RepID=UPI001CF9C0E1|nr:transcriptional regulator ATRX [Mangifera indica]
MVSSQVEFASSSPFYCVLRDFNSRVDRCRESNATAAAFQKNLKELVRGQFQNHISVPVDENLKNPVSKIDSCGAEEQGNDNQNQHHHRNLQFPSSNHSKSNKIKRSDGDSNVNSSSKQSRIRDKWATIQARVMQSKLEKQSREAELLGSSSGTPSMYNGESSENTGDSCQLQKSPSVGKSGASSLVQMWEARLNQSNSVKLNQSSESNLSRTPSGQNITEVSENPENVENKTENASSGVGEPIQQSETRDTSTDSGQQSDKTAANELPAGVVSDAGERERLRVVDIIKKLTSGTDENDGETVANASESSLKERKSISMPDQAEQKEKKVLSVSVSMPKIRGRQAFNDLLMQMEGQKLRELESLVERHAVSNFAHRGRIQAMLRVRSMQRGWAIQEQQRQLAKGSSIMHRREKFNSVAENRATAQSDASSSKICNSDIAGNPKHLSTSSSSNRLGENSQNQEVVAVGEQVTTKMENLEPKTSNQDRQKVSSPRKNVTTAEVTKALNGQSRSEIAKDQGATHGQEVDDRCLDSQDTSEIAESSNCGDGTELEEEEIYYQGQSVNPHSDWISEISRPRSYWEDCRKEWYQEMLSSSSGNNEIRQLIERRRVSTYLASDFRETMDQLVTTRVERQIELEAYEKEEQEELSRERISELLLAHLQRCMQSAASQEEEQVVRGNEVEQVDEEEQEEEEEESSRSHEERETSDYSEQSSSQTMQIASTSASYQGQEVGDESESTPEPLQAQASYPDSQLSSSLTTSLSLEMKLIYELKGQLEQLRREMNELRSSINSCKGTQVKPQHSNPQELHSVRGMGNNPPDGALKKRSCCICYEMQVDSLLYRCGHMCTCLKCAHELQWSSGKCPICRAPIEDVVRAYMDS